MNDTKLKELKEQAAKLNAIIEEEENKRQRVRYAGKTFIQQMPPEIQESPMYPYDEYAIPSEVLLFGNCDYSEHIPAAYEDIYKYIDEIQDDYDNAYFKWEMQRRTNSYEWTRKEEKRPSSDENISAILANYGIEKQNGKRWSTKELNSWKSILKNYNGTSDSCIYRLCEALQLITGNAWKDATIRGCCQGDWQQIIYNSDVYTIEDIYKLEADYFNTGAEYKIYNSWDAWNDGDGDYFYCYSWDAATEIADALGIDKNNIIDLTEA